MTSLYEINMSIERGYDDKKTEQYYYKNYNFTCLHIKYFQQYNLFLII